MANRILDKQAHSKIEQTDVLVEKFAEVGSQYYADRFRAISNSTSFTPTFNLMAFLFGPIWFGARHLWNYVVPLALIEIIAVVTLARGLFKDLGLTERLRTERILQTLETRRAQTEEALKSGTDNLENLQRSVFSLEQAVSDSTRLASAADAMAPMLVVAGLVLLLIIRGLEGVMANWALQRRFIRWRSDIDTSTGISWPNAAIISILGFFVYGMAAFHYVTASSVPFLATFPTRKSIRINATNTIKSWFESITVVGEGVFDSITYSIKLILDALEVLLVSTPWPVICVAILLLAWRIAGPRVAVFTAAGLAYIGLFGFWEKAMSTVALLGAASCISIFVGIPVGIVCARKPRVYAFVRPVLDFMQTMPSFVYLIPVIAFFGTGKPAGILATLVFGSPPVIRLTALGLQGVPQHIREAALAFGATPRFLLFKIDLPLAAPSIMAGVNQTIMLSLSMVVVASLIGAKGLGEDVLEALQFASEGQGILAGFAILFCAMILDRIIQGKKS